MRAEYWLCFLRSGGRRSHFRGLRISIALMLLMILALMGVLRPTLLRGAQGAAPRLPKVTVRLGDKTVTLWVAATNRTRDRGLMYITTMPDNRGMLFVFHSLTQQTFWMKHTLIPLDLIFLNGGGVIVRHYTMAPDNGKKLYPSMTPIRFAIELHAGEFIKLHLHDGMTVLIPSLPKRSAAQPAGHS